MESILDPKPLHQQLPIGDRLKSLGRNLRKILKEWVAYLAFYLKPSPSDQVRIILFAQGRTGSTLLETLICSAPHIKENRELLSQQNSPFQRKILFPYQYVCGLAKLSSQHFMFHAKLYHLTEQQDIDPAQFLQKLSADGWKIIYLHRDNRVMHALSNLLANQRKGYHKLNDNEENLRIHVDLDDFTKRVHKRERYFQEEQTCLKSLDYIDIGYERDLQDNTRHQETANRIFDFLGISRQPVRTQLKKINTKKLKDIVANYDEFEQHNLEHKWGPFLEE